MKELKTMHLLVFINLVLAIIFSPSLSNAATYFVDNSNGNDGNDGISQSTPWKTISKINNSVFQPGDYILFKRGETWREELIISSSGSIAKPITFGAYGTGNHPIISGANDGKALSWILTGYNSWSATVITEPQVVWLNGMKGKQRTTVSADNDYNWRSNILTLYSKANPAIYFASIEYTQRNQSLYGENKNHITIDGLAATKTNYSNILNSGGNFWIIKNCLIEDGVLNGILMNGHTALDIPIFSIEVFNNIFSSTSQVTQSLVSIRGATSPIIHNNEFKGSFGGSAITISSGGNSVGNNIIGATSKGALIYENLIHNSYSGILVQYTNNARVYRNNIHDGAGFGIAINRFSNNAEVYYNLIYNMGTDGTNAYNGIDINYGSTNGLAYNNTIYNVTGSCLTLEKTNDFSSSGWIIKNNILDSSINQLNSNGVSSSVYIDEGVTGSIFDHNMMWGTNIKRGLGIVNVTPLNSIIQWNAQTGGIDYHVDPLFEDPIAGNFNLQSTSPCINKGLNVGLTQDFSGRSVPHDGIVDIGAFEYIKMSAPKNVRIK